MQSKFEIYSYLINTETDDISVVYHSYSLDESNIWDHLSQLWDQLCNHLLRNCLSMQRRNKQDRFHPVCRLFVPQLEQAPPCRHISGSRGSDTGQLP